MKRIMKVLLIIVVVILVLGLGGLGFLRTARFGRAPRGEILKRIEASPHYRDGRFHNFVPRLSRSPDTSHRMMAKVENLRPKDALPAKPIDLFALNREDDVLVWLGHSSLFIQVNGVRFLVDPALVSGSPVFFINRPYPATRNYLPEDIPEIDYLLISHDHFDHLDYNTIKRLRDRIGKVVCGLGTGEHFRRWKFADEDIIELDWNEKAELLNDITIHTLTARHYSGRASFGVDNTLWVSFMIEAPQAAIYISGDTSYGPHFAEIGRRFDIDLAIIEFGQYNEAWRDSHIMPEEITLVIDDLGAKRNLTTHHARFVLARHPWYEPLEFVAGLREQEGYDIITPMMGELVYLTDFSQEFGKWWKNEE
ncbi:MAG: MBL fold metallo-hydrolase [Lachnospiraceae bacterium]|nr:MBL fold metallo-hydrolase [Lachnospiraceae bacterium]